MRKYIYTGETDELTTHGKEYTLNLDGTFIDDTNSVCHAGEEFHKYFKSAREKFTFTTIQPGVIKVHYNMDGQLRYITLKDTKEVRDILEELLNKYNLI